MVPDRYHVVVVDSRDRNASLRLEHDQNPYRCYHLALHHSTPPPPVFPWPAKADRGLQIRVQVTVGPRRQAEASASTQHWDNRLRPPSAELSTIPMCCEARASPCLHHPQLACQWWLLDTRRIHHELQFPRPWDESRPRLNRRWLITLHNLSLRYPRIPHRYAQSLRELWTRVCELSNRTCVIWLPCLRPWQTFNRVCTCFNRLSMRVPFPVSAI